MHGILLPMNLTGLALALLSTIGFGTVTVLVTQSTRKIGPIASLFLYEALGIPLFLFLIPMMPTTPVRANIWPIMIVGILFSFVYLLFLHAAKIGTLAIVGPINQLYMVITTILSVLFLHEPFSLWKGTGMFFVFAGVVLLGLQLPRKKKSFQLLASVPYALVSAVGTGLYLYAIAILSRTNGWFLNALFIRIAISATTFVVLLFRHFNFSILRKNIPWKNLLLAASFDVMAFSLYNYTIAHYEVSTITIITATQSAVIVLLSWKLLKERLNKQQVVGFFVILAGLVSLQLR